MNPKGLTFSMAGIIDLFSNCKFSSLLELHSTPLYFKKYKNATPIMEIIKTMKTYNNEDRREDIEDIDGDEQERS